ncbi:MAG: hypothetical protein ACYC6L_01500 [Anaerolineae bacterium]
MGSKLVRFEIRFYPGARVIGKSALVREPAQPGDTTIERLWAELARDGSLAILETLPGRITADTDTAGWMGDWVPGAGSYTYLAGMLFIPGTPVPEGLAMREIQPGEMAAGTLAETDGEEGGELHGAASGIVGRARDAAGYTYDPSRGLFEMEVYTREHFYRALERGEKVRIDFYSPCRQLQLR